jgi:hypothetical protein
MRIFLDRLRGVGVARVLAALLLAALLSFVACGSPETETAELPPPVAAATATAAAPPTTAPTSAPPAPLPTPIPTVAPSATTSPEEPPAEPVPTIAVASADGGVRLLLPETALPAGVDPADISLARVPVAEFADAFPEGGPDFAVRLEPDGLRFDAPVTIEVVVENPGEGVPILWQLSDDGLELLTATTSTVDPDTGRLTVSGEISHFSSVIGDLDGFFAVTVSNPGDRFVGESFTVTVVIKRTGVQPRGVSGSLVFMSRTVDPWTAVGLFTHVGPAPVPSRVPDLPPGTAMYGPTLTLTADFTCKTAGQGNFNYHARLRYFVESTNLGEEEQVWKTSEYESGSAYYTGMFMKCLPAPTPTDTPSNTPTPEGSVEAEVLHQGDQRYPLEQFRVAPPDACGKDHYHASVAVHSLEGGTTVDPAPTRCGFGEVGTPGLVTTVRVSAEEWAAYRTALAGP